MVLEKLSFSPRPMVGRRCNKFNYFCLTNMLINSCPFIFSSGGEWRTREGNDLYREMMESGVIKLGDIRGFSYFSYKMCTIIFIVIWWDFFMFLLSRLIISVFLSMVRWTNVYVVLIDCGYTFQGCRRTKHVSLYGQYIFCFTRIGLLLSINFISFLFNNICNDFGNMIA